MASSVPMPAAPIEEAYLVTEPGAADPRSATPIEARKVGALLQPGLPPDAIAGAVSTGGSVAWSWAKDPSYYASATNLAVRLSNGRVIQCAGPGCDDRVIGAWWDSGGTELRYLSVGGWAQSVLTLYRWRVGKAQPKPVLVTNDILADCKALVDDLMCVQEGSLQPRRIIKLNPVSGVITPLYDPNPEFQNLDLGTVERLHWKNDEGLETIGDLVLPPSHRPGQRHPLIVVQYTTRGFLRGGTGDEYPIQLFANHGFAVLSFQRPEPFYTTLAHIDTSTERQKVELEGWKDRRSVQSSLQHGVQIAIDQGVVDPTKLGITGQSDGASTAIFALLHDNKFSVASLSSCCEDPVSAATMVGPSEAVKRRQRGWPGVTEDKPDFWRGFSLARNAETVSTPILLQLSEDEYLVSLETYTALTEYDQPVDMFVFPGENHVKWQPAHRRALYQRNLDWFDFWLKAVEDPDPKKREQYIRWREMRTRQTTLPR